MLYSVIKLLPLFLILFAPIAHSAVEVRWLSVASVMINDGTTKLLIDAAWTRPGFLHWLGISDFKSDEKMVKTVLDGQGIQTLDGVFVTHTHFDHCVDAAVVARMTKAPLYASKSMKRIADAHKDPGIVVKKLKEMKIGDFRIRQFSRVHAHILGLFEFLPGTVRKDFDFGFYDYKVGESWIYLIEHPDGKILVDTSGDANLEAMPKDLKVDVVIQGVANRESNETIIDGYVKTLGAKKFIATHFDPFMFSFTPGPQEALWNVDFPGLEKSFAEKAKETEFIIPEYGKPIRLF